MSGYVGDHEGTHWSSLYRNLYRVQYRARIAGRDHNVDKIVSAMDEHHARERQQRSSGATVYGAITVEHVHTLEAA